MSLSDIYEVTHVQRYGSGGERTMNRYYYVKAGSGETADDLGNHWLDAGTVHDALLTAQTNLIKDESLRIINLGDLTDFFDTNLVGTGQQALDTLPIHNAVSMSLKLDTRAIRPGGKRFVGVSETSQTNGVLTDATAIGLWNTLRGDLEEDIIGEDTGIYRPCVVKRVLVPEVDETHPAHYRLPTTDGELVVGRITAALMGLKVSHQTSRGNGR